MFFIQPQKQYLFALNRIIEHYKYKKTVLTCIINGCLQFLPHIILLYYTAQPKFTVNIHFKPERQ